MPPLTRLGSQNLDEPSPIKNVDSDTDLSGLGDSIQVEMVEIERFNVKSKPKRQRRAPRQIREYLRAIHSPARKYNNPCGSLTQPFVSAKCHRNASTRCTRTWRPVSPRSPLPSTPKPSERAIEWYWATWNATTPCRTVSIRSPPHDWWSKCGTVCNAATGCRWPNTSRFLPKWHATRSDGIQHCCEWVPNNYHFHSRNWFGSCVLCLFGSTAWLPSPKIGWCRARDYWRAFWRVSSTAIPPKKRRNFSASSTTCRRIFMCRNTAIFGAFLSRTKISVIRHCSDWTICWRSMPMMTIPMMMNSPIALGGWMKPQRTNRMMNDALTVEVFRLWHILCILRK